MTALAHSQLLLEDKVGLRVVSGPNIYSNLVFAKVANLHSGGKLPINGASFCNLIKHSAKSKAV